MIVLSCVVIALAALVVAGDQVGGEGLDQWAAAMFVAAIAFGVFALRERLPLLTSSVLGNTLLAAVCALVLEALLKFLRQPSPRYLVWAPAVLMMMATLALLHQPLHTLVAGCLLLSVPIGGVLWLLHRHAYGIPGRGKYLLTAGAVLLLLLMLGCAGLALTGQLESGPALGGTPVLAQSLIVIFIVINLASYGFVFMTKERSDEKNRQLAMHDALTGIPNRRAVMLALEQQFSMALRNRQPLSVLMLDIDHFKRINDCFGHPAGDEVLCGVAQRIGERLRVQDTVGRFGGEEFLIVLPGTAVEGALLLAEDLRASIAANPVLTTWNAVTVTASLGVFGGLIDEAQELDSLLERADQALYRAKLNGRNRVERA